MMATPIVTRSVVEAEGNRMSRVASLMALSGTLLLGACVVVPPSEPGIVAMPGKDKTLEAFQQDDAACRQYASQAIGNRSPAAAANESAVTSGAAGTVLGAAAGAAIGAAAGNPAAGAAIGAGSGLVLGSAAGVNAAQLSGDAAQRQYDISYAQCMVSKGDTIASPQPAAVPYPVYPPYYYPPPYAYPYPPYYPGYYYPPW
jgi:hypothetical protein